MNKNVKTGTPLVKASVERPLSWSILILVASVFGCFALPPRLQAVVPPPDGGYPGGNTAEGQSALLDLTTGGFNTAVGFLSLRSNRDSSFNTAVGAGALLANIAFNNTATGAGALLSNTKGEENTAHGAFALLSNTEGLFNTAMGAFALQNNTTGSQNTAVGNSALVNNSDGNFNTAVGDSALFANTSGEENTANGQAALGNNTEGRLNTATGANALRANISGDGNTAVGHNALDFNTSGSNNIAVGESAGNQVTTASNVICIGRNVGGANVDNGCFIGNIRDAVVAPDAQQVLIDSAGKLGTTNGSSNRFKKDIKAMKNASEAILALRPVKFHYKSDNTNTPQFGLIAEEVAKVSPDLVVRDKNGQVYTVRYDAVNAMLLNEFLEEHKTVQALKKEIAGLAAKLKEQNTKIQSVRRELQLRKPAPRVVQNR
jgi:Chaperone of endosialidase